MMNTEEREKFEAALRKSDALASHSEEYTILALQLNSAGTFYPTTWVQSAWMGWQLACADNLCPACGGSCEVSGMQGSGPDAYEVSCTCPHCNGTGALADAYRGVVALLAIEQKKSMEAGAKLYMQPAPVSGTTSDEQEIWIAFNSEDDDEPVMFFTELPGQELKSRFYLRHFFMRDAPAAPTQTWYRGITGKPEGYEVATTAPAQTPSAASPNPAGTRTDP
jgi:hypothetical protein